VSERPIWAPWRLEYVAGSKSGECPFCQAARGEEPASSLVVARGDRCLALLNRFPYASGHLMVSPQRHVGELEDLDHGELTELMALTRTCVLGLRGSMRPDGFNVGLNLGRSAGAGIAAHLHQHVVPRWDGDTNFMPVVGKTGVVSQSLDATRDVLVEALRPLGAGP
jgi:ATP adenylyltransferase